MGFMTMWLFLSCEDNKVTHSEHVHMRDKVLVQFCYAKTKCYDSVTVISLGDSIWKESYGFLVKRGRLYVLVDTFVNLEMFSKISIFDIQVGDTIFKGTPFIIRYDTLDMPKYIYIYDVDDTVVFYYYKYKELVIMNLGKELGSWWYKKLIGLDSLVLKRLLGVIRNEAILKDTFIYVYIITKPNYVYLNEMQQKQFNCNNKIIVFTMLVQFSLEKINIVRYYINNVFWTEDELPCY